MFKTFQVESLKSDTIFKKAFRQKDIFTGLVKDFTGVQIEIDEVENDKAFVQPVGKVNIHFDLFAEDKKNRIIVEAQHATSKSLSYYLDRFFHYHAAAMLEMIRSSADYHFPQLVLTLVFFTKVGSPKSGHNILVQDTEVRTERTGEIVDLPKRLKHKMFFIFTSDPHNDLDAKDACSQWIEAINDTMDGHIYSENDYTNRLIQQMFEIISVEKTTPEEKVKMQAEVTQEVLDNAKMEGRKEGRNEVLLELQMRLKQLGEFSDEKIANLLDLPLEEVQAR